MNPLIQGHSGSVPETSRNTLATKRGTNEDDSQTDHHPEGSVSQSQTTRKSGLDDGYDNTLKIYARRCYMSGLFLYFNLQLIVFKTSSYLIACSIFFACSWAYNRRIVFLTRWKLKSFGFSRSNFCSCFFSCCSILFQIVFLSFFFPEVNLVTVASRQNLV